MKKVIEELSRRNPYEFDRKKRAGYMEAVSTLRKMLEQPPKLAEDINFLLSAYEIKSKELNDYHLRLSHDDFDGYFDWYHTTGTLIACKKGQNANKNVTKTKDVEEIALAVMKFVNRRLTI